jgi:hypothetical protein
MKQRQEGKATPSLTASLAEAGGDAAALAHWRGMVKSHGAAIG